ncbi:hypothetical protein [Halalkalibaculum sp. DA384]|uniref:hypothetical protein n=1 Tax=Halalkalibaculum sp. DA384 TaxID=3373606 RepID=UPI0037544EE5
MVSKSGITFIDHAREKADVVAPPGTFEQGSLRFVRSALDEDSSRNDALARKYHRHDPVGQQFSLVLNAVDGEPVVVRLRENKEIPNADVALVNPATGRQCSLDATEIEITLTPESAVTDMVLLVGDEQYLERQKSEYLPQTVDIQPNYPNPFNPTTTLQFALPEQAKVRLRVYDVMGRRVGNPRQRSAGGWSTFSGF